MVQSLTPYTPETRSESARPEQDLTPATVVLQPLPGIGDMVWHIPVLKALAATDPCGRIDLMGQDKLPLQALLARESSVNRIFGLPVDRSMVGRIRVLRTMTRLLRSQGYKRIFILHHSWRYALAARLAGVPQIYGYGFGAQKMLLTQRQVLPDGDRKIFPLRRSEKLLDLAGISGYKARPSLSADSELADRVARAYSAYPQPWIAFGFGARDPARIWPPARFAAVADALWQAGARSIFLLGSSSERVQAETIAQACATAKPLAVIDRPFGESMALLSRCALAVCNDSGLMNVAAALGIPVYVPFGVSIGTRGGYNMTHVNHLQALLAPYLHAVLPADDADATPDAARVSADLVLTRLASDGILAALGEQHS